MKVNLWNEGIVVKIKFLKYVSFLSFGLILPPILASCSSVTNSDNNQTDSGNNNDNNQPDSDDDNNQIGSGSNNDNNQNPQPPQTNNPIDYLTWNNAENKANKFSTVNVNQKLDIVEKRGAYDIEDADFNDGRLNCDPLKGNILNEKYLQLSKISYSVNFKRGGDFLGTAWLLDYQIPDNINELENGNSYNSTNYPTKWYFATNTHVMDDLRTTNSLYESINTKQFPDLSTSYVSLTRIKNPEIGVGPNGNYLKSSLNNESYETFYFYQTRNVNDPIVKPIFLGYDFLTSKPKDYINNIPVPNPDSLNDDYKYVDTEEMADFSVFEIDFSKVAKDDYINSNIKNAHELAQYVTSNYANWSNQEKFKIPNESLLYKPNEIKNNKYYALGFPKSYGPIDNSVNLYVNRPQNLATSEYQNAGAKVVNERHYNTFKNAMGIFDLSIGSPDFGYKFQPSTGITSLDGVIPFIYQGLAYVDQNGDMNVGSSGSIFVDENNYIQGIHFASDFTAHVGINYSLLCEGYNYNNAYGNYNLVGYDLIRGGYPLQRSSYREEMIKWYPENTRTYIFQDGLKK